MNKIKTFLKEEKAAAQMVEAAIIYPIVFLIIFLMIYIGLYILQAISIGTYAQKVAMLASREISTPGYHVLIGGDRYSDASIELNTNDIEKIDDIVNIKGMAKSMTKAGVIYRYWKLGDSIMTDESKEYYSDILTKMITNNSIIAPQKNGKLNVTVNCTNYVISQTITVTAEQELMHLGILEFFGVESPTVSATAVATVSDTDEFIRNTDFVSDAINALAEKLGIDMDSLSGKVNDVLEKLGLLSD